MVNFLGYNKIICLGSNCYAKMLLDSGLKIKQNTHFFDYIGTSMWSILELLKNNFEGMYERENYKKIRVLKSEGDDFMITNIKYYIRVKHDFKQNFKVGVEDEIKEEEFKKFIEKYKRREERIKEIFDSEEAILFIRYEEQNQNRINYYENKIEEYEGIIKFLKEMRNKNDNTSMIYLSETRETNYDKDNRILTLNVKEKINHWSKAPDILKKVILKNEEELKKIELVN